MLHQSLAALALFTSVANACFNSKECPSDALCYESYCRTCSVGSLCTSFGGCCDGMYCSTKGRCDIRPEASSSTKWMYLGIAVGVFLFLFLLYACYCSASQKKKRHQQQQQHQQQQFQPDFAASQQLPVVYVGQAFNNDQQQYQGNHPNHPPPK
ncbi:hypothetical protein BDR26DRAFT_852358 [Obelidium mucronatum]|nr:hypothetical protein BDR26DRAFT_852358 [Obelidium mucronatum]